MGVRFKLWVVVQQGSHLCVKSALKSASIAGHQSTGLLLGLATAKLQGYLSLSQGPVKTHYGVLEQASWVSTNHLAGLLQATAAS